MAKSLVYSLKQALMQIARNKSMTLSSLFSITAMLLILGMFFVLAVNVNLMTESAKNQFDTVEIFIVDNASDEEVAKLRDKLETSSYSGEVTYLDKEDAMEIMKSRWGERAYMLDGIPENPLPRSIQIRLENVEESDEFVEYVNGFENPIIEDIKYGESAIKKMIKITDGIQIGALVVIAFLIIVSVVVVSNTIKLTVLARGREISIMKYVGATNWFIRGPFLAEGIIIGIVAAVISAIIMSVLYSMLKINFSEQMLLMFSTGLVPVSFLAGNLIVIFLSLGVSIGAIGSLISMRRFLDA